MAIRLLLISSASVHTWRYLSGIAPYVDEVYLACNGEIPKEHNCPANLVDVLQVDFHFTSWLTLRRLRAWVAAIRPDVVHVHQANSVAWHACRALTGSAIPLVLTVWGSDVLLLPQRSALMRYIVLSNLQAAAIITSDSLYVAAIIRNLLGDTAAIEVVNFGIDMLPPAMDVAQKQRRVLSCRLHKPLYRIDIILRAWSQVERCGRFPHWSLTIAADGEESSALQILARQLKLTRVEFTGFISSDSLAHFYQQSRVFISIPQSDATSMSLLEAMGYGCFPVLSNLPANGEWVINGVNGMIVENVHHLGQSLVAGLTEAEDNQRLATVARLNRQLIADKALRQQNMQYFAHLYARLLAPAPCGTH